MNNPTVVSISKCIWVKRAVNELQCLTNKKAKLCRKVLVLALNLSSLETPNSGNAIPHSYTLIVDSCGLPVIIIRITVTTHRMLGCDVIKTAANDRRATTVYGTVHRLSHRLTAVTGHSTILLCYAFVSQFSPVSFFPSHSVTLR